MEYKEKFIGEGNFWNVRRVFIVEDGIVKTHIQKISKKRSQDNISTNLKNYALVYSTGLPTLAWFTRANDETEIIETEDLNPPDKCDGYFVSPNTIRNCPSYASLYVKFLNSNCDVETFIKDNDVDSELEEYLKKPLLTQENIEIMRNTLIAKGAEGKVYSTKITEIKNLSDFLIEARDEMKRAAECNIELFSDAFFFRLKESIKQIEYKIADFDCIISLQDKKTNKNKLYKRNLEYLTTSLCEYIVFFVIKDKNDEYLRIIDDFNKKNVS